MISILCSVYNSSGYLDRYLSYLNEQTLLGFEIIFVDANSTDDSVEKIKNFKFREDIVVKLLEQEERIPIYSAWNLAIENSSNDYVMNFNTDDKLFKTALSGLATEALKNLDADVLYSGHCLMTSHKDHSQIDGCINWMDAAKPGNLIKGCCVGPFPLLKKKSVIDAGMFNPYFTISGDYD